MNKERKHYTAEEKVAILRRHLLEKERMRQSNDRVDCGGDLSYWVTAAQAAGVSSASR